MPHIHFVHYKNVQLNKISFYFLAGSILLSDNINMMLHSFRTVCIVDKVGKRLKQV